MFCARLFSTNVFSAGSARGCERRPFSRSAIRTDFLRREVTFGHHSFGILPVFGGLKVRYVDLAESRTSPSASEAASPCDHEPT